MNFACSADCFRTARVALTMLRNYVLYVACTQVLLSLQCQCQRARNRFLYNASMTTSECERTRTVETLNYYCYLPYVDENRRREGQGQAFKIDIITLLLTFWRYLQSNVRSCTQTVNDMDKRRALQHLSSSVPRHRNCAFAANWLAFPP